LCTGPNLPPESIAKLHDKCPDGVTIREFLPNLAAHLKQAKLSISQVGYNTAMDVLSAGENGDCKALFVPSDIAGQSEQLRRASLLHLKKYAINLPESQMNPKSLADAIDRALNLPPRSMRINFVGADTSAAIIDEIIDEHGI
jgi:predicted glycosyltransferase